MSIVSDYTSLLSGGSWTGQNTFNTPVILSYSFETVAPAYLATDGGYSSSAIASFRQFDETDKGFARNALQQWSAVSGLRFVEAAPGTGDIRFSKLDFNLVPGYSSAAGFAYLPTRTLSAQSSTESRLGGDVFINTRVTDILYYLLHEVGHALGLKHPFDGNPTLTSSLDNRSNTVMSYTGSAANTLAWLDVQAIQSLYGTTNSSNWAWNEAAGELTQVGTGGSETIFGTSQRDIIYGGDGNDLIGGFAGDDYLDGGDGIDSMVGGAGNDTYVVDNIQDRVTEWSGEGTDQVLSSVSYALPSYVENLTLIGGGNIDGTGNELANIIIGNSGNNVIDGGGGADTIDGGGGLNTARYAQARAFYSLSADYYGAHVTDFYATDTLNNIQQVSFADGTFSLASLLTFVLEASGVTRLVQVINQLFLRDAADNGPALTLQGDRVRIGQFAEWNAIGAEKVAGGYEVMWRAGANQFRVWRTDLGGNYVGAATDVLSGADYGVQSRETLFQQDFNNDGQLGPTITPIESFGGTSLDHIANAFLMDDGVGAGSLLSYQGAVVVTGQFGGWAPIAAEKSGTGYQVVFKSGSGGASQYVVWNVDANGNYTSAGSGVMAGTDPTLQGLETTFQQDLNGDGNIGLLPVTIEAFGTTRLVELGNLFQLRDGTGTGPVLKYLGTAVLDGQTGTWKPIGAEETAGGYQVAWKNGSADQYTVWSTGGDGNYSGSPVGVVSGGDYALQSLETTFQQDLNGDSVIGPKTTTVEAFGATRLDQVANRFFLHDGGGNGPALKYQGMPVVLGQFDAWKPIAAEQVGGGYQVMFKNGGASQFVVWNVAADGGYASPGSGLMAGSDVTLQVLELTFQQDLNGDSQIGPPTTTIEALGVTRLVEVGNEFFLRDGVGNGPFLKYQGAAVLDGQLGPWKPIATEKTANGYQVVFKNGGADQYALWNTGNDGNYSGNPIGVVSSADYALQSLEPTFQQDLNGDGLIGPKTTTIESFGGTRLDQVANEFFLHDSGGNGPALKYQGIPVVGSGLGTWRPIGAEKTASGYEVAWKNGNADQYTVWFTGNDGNYSGSPIGVVSGSSSLLTSFEMSFQQDLNGDHNISPSAVPLIDAVSSSLVPTSDPMASQSLAVDQHSLFG